MKKLKTILFVLLLSALFLLITPSTSNAAFYINNYDIEAELLENGSMQITENIQYYSTEIKNGVTRDICLVNQSNKNNSASSFTLNKVLIDNVTAKRVSYGSNGDDGVFEYSQKEDTYSLKVYMPMSSSLNKRTVTYKYTLKNVAVKYNDTAELFWNFIGDQWDTDIKNVHIKITLPDDAKSDTIYVYGHGSDNGRFEKTNNVIDLYATDLKPHQALDARILFSTSAIPHSKKMIDSSVLTKYINQEEGIVKKYEEAELFMGLGLSDLTLILSVSILIIGLFLYFKFDREYKVEKVHYFREVPFGLSPEILQTIYYGKIKPNAFFITFLNLLKKGVFKISKTQNEVGKETQLITYNTHHGVELEDYEKSVVSQIKSCMSSNSIDILKLNQKLKLRSLISRNKYQLQLNAKKDSLFGEKAKAPKRVTTFLSILMVILVVFISILAIILSPENGIGVLMFLGFTTLIYSIIFKSIGFSLIILLFMTFHCGAFQFANFMLLSSCGIELLYIPYVLLFILLQYSFRIQKAGIEERQVIEKIKGLRRYIKDYSYLAEKENIQEVTLWEDFFILSIALGLNKKTVNYFYDYCSNNLHDNFGESLNGFSSYDLLLTGIGTSFIAYSHSSSGSSSSYSGSSGGFSGGSSSGGGGRRWRRRKLILKNPKNSNFSKLEFLDFIIHSLL